MFQLKIIVGSTRPGRKGIHVADWFSEKAREFEDFEVEMLDLAEMNLPILDEPNHPRKKQYTKQHTIEWSKKVAEADAFVVITPEYNYFAPPALVNAFDYLYHEWNYKPIGIVSYGGISGGLRAAQSLKQMMMTLKLVPLPEGVALPFFESRINDHGRFTADEMVDKSVAGMMKELLKWTKGLKAMRASDNE